MKKIIICLLLSTICLSACSLNDSKNSADTVDSNSKTTNEESKNIEEKSNTSSKESKSSSSKEKSTKEIAKKVKDYINNGQVDKPEATKLKWSKTFLDKVDIDTLYKKYVANGGDAENIEKIAEYITLNTPVPIDWQELFKKDLKNSYDEEIVKLEHLEGDSYEAYVNKEGKEVPFVVVSSRTGYFHG